MRQLSLRHRLAGAAITAVAAATVLSLAAAPAQAAPAVPAAPSAGLVMGFGCATARTGRRALPG